MKKLFITILTLILISESLYAEGYVGLTDYDVQRFIVCLNEVIPDVKKNNGNYDMEYLTKKYGSEPFVQNGKLDVLTTGFTLALFYLNYPNPAEFQQLEAMGIDVWSFLLMEGGIDYRDTEVLARHKKEFINAAAICL